MFSEASVMKSKLKKGEDMKNLDKVPTKTILKVVPESKPSSRKDDLAGDSKTLKGGKSQIMNGGKSGPELTSSKSTNNLNQIKKILTGKNPEKILQDIMEVTEVDKKVNIGDVNNKVVLAPKNVSFKDNLGGKSVQLKGKPAAGGKPPATTPAKGGKSTAPSRSKSPMTGGMKKGVSTNNLLKKGVTSLAMNKTKSTNNLKGGKMPELGLALNKSQNPGIMYDEVKREPFILKGVPIWINPTITHSMDVKLIYLLLEAKGIIIQRCYRRHYYRKKGKAKKAQRFWTLIKLNFAKRIFNVLYNKIDIRNNLKYLDTLLTELFGILRKQNLLYKLGAKHDLIIDVLKIQRRYRTHVTNKLRKNRLNRLNMVIKLFNNINLNDGLHKMKKICDVLKTRDMRLLDTIQKVDAMIDLAMLRNFFKIYVNTHRRMKAVTKMESVFLYKLIGDFTDCQEKYFTVNKLIIRDEEEENYIDNLKKDTLVGISTYVKAKIKNFLVTQFMLHSLEGGILLVSKRIKFIFKEMCENIESDKYFLNFDENCDLENSLEINPYNKIKFRTKNYFLVNLFKIQKTFLEYHYSNTRRNHQKILLKIVLNKAKKEKRILEKYFTQYKLISMKPEDLLEKAFNILNKNNKIRNNILNEKEKKLKRVIYISIHKLLNYGYDCFDNWRRLNALHYQVVKIQTAWRNYQQKSAVKYEDIHEMYASWSIHLKQMRKMEEIFKTIFYRTHKMAFKWFIIKLAAHASCFGKPGSNYRKTMELSQYETVLQANVSFRKAKANYKKYILLTIINYRLEKETLIIKNFFNVIRRHAKLKKLIDSVIKIQRVYLAKRSTIKTKKAFRSRTKLYNMFRKSFLNRLVRMLKIIKLTFYEFFMAKDYHSDDPAENPCIDLLRNIKLIFAKKFFRHMLIYDRMYMKLRCIQLFWKTRMKLIKSRRIKEIIKTFTLTKIRHNKRIFHKSFDRWLNTSLFLTINLAVDVLSKFLYNNYILKKRFKKFLRRIIIKKFMRELTQAFIFGKKHYYRR